jgi:2-polyprenyl-6-methoxyphenol hydroxylase-like FAD-dependent oxidoreductase
MSIAIDKALIVGGGFSGMSAAIQLRKFGVNVDLVEIDRDWRSYGAGITLGGAALRAFRTIGVLDQMMKLGALTDGCDIFTSQGHLIAQLPTPRCAGNEVPGSGGIMRPVLARILAEATRASGTNVRLGCTFTDISPKETEVAVTFNDGSRGTYDLVIGADGLNSATRRALFPEAPHPRYTGQGVWRAVAPRDGVERAGMALGKHTKAGFNPVSATELYLFVTEDRPTNTRTPDAELLPRLRGLLEEFSFPVVRRIADNLGPDSLICYRPLEALLMPKPWSRGRVVLIGDAIHATTPHLAAGAGIGIEDAIVLAEQLASTTQLQAALEAFQQRRWERCRMVVENSARLGEIEAQGGDQQEHGRIMRESLIALAAPA